MSPGGGSSKKNWRGADLLFPGLTGSLLRVVPWRSPLLTERLWARWTGPFTAGNAWLAHSPNHLSNLGSGEAPSNSDHEALAPPITVVRARGPRDLTPGPILIRCTTGRAVIRASPFTAVRRGCAS